VQIEFSKYDLSIKVSGQQEFIFDIIRKKYVLLTPEEWVRQHIVHYLINDYKFPKSLISVEKQLFLNDLLKRTDIVLYNHDAKPVLIVECKAPHLKLTQKNFGQIARYNLTLGVNYLWVSNGNKNYLCNINHQEKSFTFLSSLPHKDKLLQYATR
jgi:type I site-specific restriction endonuclease